MNYELLGIFLTVVIQAIYFAHKMGIIEKSIYTLEAKQDKHNNLIERMVRVEDGIKSAHIRLDTISREI